MNNQVKVKVDASFMDTGGKGAGERSIVSHYNGVYQLISYEQVHTRKIQQVSIECHLAACLRSDYSYQLVTTVFNK